MSKDLTSCLAVAMSRGYHVRFSPDPKKDGAVNIRVDVTDPEKRRTSMTEIKAADVFAYGPETMLASAVERGSHTLGKMRP